MIKSNKNLTDKQIDKMDRRNWKQVVSRSTKFLKSFEAMSNVFYNNIMWETIENSI